MTIKIGIINGPNLNLIGIREPEVYGNERLSSYLVALSKKYESQFEIAVFQSNIEGELISKIQQWGFEKDGIILNAAAYSHTSIAIADAVKSIPCQSISVHISNIFKREIERKTDLISAYAQGGIYGLGLKGYELALQYFVK